jgi:hypothetical protein
VKKAKETKEINMTDEPLSGSVAERWEAFRASLAEDEPPYLSTPWPDLDPIARLNHRRKVGFVARRGSREATVGRRIAVHVARAGHRVLLYTRYGPADPPPTLTVDDSERVDTEALNERAGSLRERGLPPDLVVIERAERMRKEGWYGEHSTADQMMLAGQQIFVDVPVVLTTVVDKAPDPKRRIVGWAGVDSAAAVLTDICRSVLVLERQDHQTVVVHTELDRDLYTHPRSDVVAWKR